MQEDDGPGPGRPPCHVGQESEPLVRVDDHGVHGARRLRHREGGVGEVFVVGEAGAILADEDIPGAAVLVSGDVLGEDVEHALDLA